MNVIKNGLIKIKILKLIYLLLFLMLAFFLISCQTDHSKLFRGGIVPYNDGVIAIKNNEGISVIIWVKKDGSEEELYST